MLLDIFRAFLTVFLILTGTANAVNSAHNGAAKPMAMMVLQGAPVFGVSPSGTIDFGPSAVGVNTPHAFPVPMIISNPGSADLTTTLSFTSFDYEFTAETFVPGPLTVPPGGNRERDIIFQPQAAGTRNEQFISVDNAAGSPHMVSLKGTGVNVAAKDFAFILDPAMTAVGVSPGKTTSFNVWVLAGPGLPLGSNASLQCSGGPSGTSCSLATNTFSIDDVSPFDETRQSIAVSVTVPARSASLLQYKNVFWSIPAVCGIVLAFGRRRDAVRLLLLSILVLGLSLVVSCGGSSSSMNSNSLTMTASREGTTHTISVPLNMQ